MKKLLFSIFAVCLVGLSYAQTYTVSPSCPDFTDINASYTEATYGKTGNPFASQGVVAGRHTVITAQGTDSYTGNALSLLPPGESAVIRLGNEKTGADAEAITYHFMVDPNFPVLFVKFAVVFQDPGHQTIEQPRFVMRIMDKNGNLIEDCAEYDVSAGGNIPGFQTAGSGYSPVRWRDWTNVGLDMSAYTGKEVQAQFITYDCTLSGHYGYAYFTASCISNKLEMSTCAGNSFTVEAPDGFASYLWDNGDKTRTTTRTKTGGDMNLSCVVTSATGCRFTLSAFVSSAATPGAGGNISDVICQGQPYTKHYFNLPPQTEAGTFTHYNTFLNPNTCSGNVTTTLTLKVEQAYYPLKATICHGEDYTKNGFTILAPPVGSLRDTLSLTSKTGGCDSIICLELEVSPSFNMPNTITGDVNPCTNQPVSYSFGGASGIASYNWEVPGNAHIISGKSKNSITVYFTDDTPGNIILKGENGCGTGAIPLAIKPRKSYETLINDTICAGDVYNAHGFKLGIQDSTGDFTHVHHEKTTLGCDSITTLALVVFPTPTVRIEMEGDSVLCSPQTITLHAIGENASISFGTVPEIAIGDILCADGSIVKPDKYAGSGKIAKGVVAFVDLTGEHGWALNFDYEPGGQWATSGFNVASLPDLTRTQALHDFNGYTNTQIIRSASNPALCPPFWSINFADGWYIPSAGQARMIISNAHSFNSTLSMLGATLLDDATLCTSSEVGYMIYTITTPGLLNNTSKTTVYPNFRSIIDF